MDNQELINSLSEHPALKKRVEEMLKIVRSSPEEIEFADTAEERIIEEGRHLNREALQAWADRQASIHSTRFEDRHKNTSKSGEKNSTGIAP
jgi:hypothetical protein